MTLNDPKLDPELENTLRCWKRNNEFQVSYLQVGEIYYRIDPRRPYDHGPPVWEESPSYGTHNVTDSLISCSLAKLLAEYADQPEIAQLIIDKVVAAAYP